MKINAITEDDIKYLKPDQLVELLDILLSAEIARTYTPGELLLVSIPRPITVKDGGEDANVTINIPDNDNRLSRSHWIQSKYTSFQSKAQKMTDKDCYNEVLENNKNAKTLKPRVKACFDNDGEYILFTTDSLTDISVKNRIKSIKKALEECMIVDFDKKKIRILDANQIARWANEFLKAIIFVQGCRGITRLDHFRTWNEWNIAYRIEKKYEYQESEILKTYSDKLYEVLEKENIVRVIGHKGLGKTRLVLESFNPNSLNTNIKNLSNLVVYIDLATADPKALSGFLISHNNLEGIIIVDNCPDTWHDNFYPLVKTNSNLKMVTINDSPFNQKENTLVLDRKMQRDVVKMIFKNCFQGLSDSEIEHLVNISEGFPEMVPFIDNIIKGKDAQLIYSTIPSEFITKFLFAENKNDMEYELFKACSVFTEFAFYDDKIEDILSDNEKGKIDAQNKLIYEEITKQPANKNFFYQFCTKYRHKRTLLEPKGRNFSVIPEPIAVNLAAEWWEQTPFSFVQNLMKELNDTGLLIPMMDRLKSLDQSEKAQQIVAKAWGQNGPFSTAEVLNTDLGSRLFRSVVEVNPEETVKALTYTFEDHSTEELKSSLLIGRRNIVWALEKLAFRKETFTEAAKMLCRLAAAENENYGNNATGQFKQLFHIHLAGTEANYSDRFEILSWGLKEEEAIQLTVISAAGHGLKAHGFHRTIGAEEQGFGKRFKDYEPASWSEIYNYWEHIIQELVESAKLYENLRIPIKKQISSSVRSMFSSNQSKVIARAIEELNQIDNELWSDAISELKKTKNYENLSDVDLNKIDHLLALLYPRSIKDKLNLIVSMPAWDYSRENIRQEVVKQNAEKFAIEVLSLGIDLNPYLVDLLSGEQRQTFAFGVKISLHDNIEKLVDSIISRLATISEPLQNPALLAGILSALPKDQQRITIQKLISSESLIKHVFYLIRIIQPDKSEIESLFTLVDSGKVGIEHFVGFQYGRALDNLELAEVVELCQKISEYGRMGAWTAFLLLAQFCYDSEDKWAACKALVRKLMLENNILTDFDEAKDTDEYLWSKYLLKLLEEEQDVELAGNFSRKILDAADRNDFPAYESFLKDVIKVLCERYFKTFWDVIKNELLEDTLSFYKLKTLLGSHNGAYGYDGLLFSGDVNEILEWAKENKPKAAYRIAYMMPIYGEQSWSNFSLKMIDEFGNDEKFLSEIASNMGSFSMIGSSENYYKRIIFMAEEMRTHKFAKVRKWAKNCILHYQKQIRREKLEDEQRS